MTQPEPLTQRASEGELVLEPPLLVNLSSSALDPLREQIADGLGIPKKRKKSLCTKNRLFPGPEVAYHHGK